MNSNETKREPVTSWNKQHTAEYSVYDLLRTCSYTYSDREYIGIVNQHTIQQKQTNERINEHLHSSTYSAHTTIKKNKTFNIVWAVVLLSLSNSMPSYEHRLNGRSRMPFTWVCKLSCVPAAAIAVAAVTHKTIDMCIGKMKWALAMPVHCANVYSFAILWIRWMMMMMMNMERRACVFCICMLQMGYYMYACSIENPFDRFFFFNLFLLFLTHLTLNLFLLLVNS